MKPLFKLIVPSNLILLWITIFIGMVSCEDIDIPVDDLTDNDLIVTETPSGGAVLNYKWGVDQITWSYEPSEDYPEFMSEIIYALDVWQNHTSDFSFYYAGENNNAANLYFVDATNEAGIFQAKQKEACSFLDSGSKMRAFSCLAEDVPGRDLLTRDQIKIFIASESKGREVKFVLAHETGHALGLAHTITCEFDIIPIMYSGSNPCNVPSTDYELHASDIEALHVHYTN